MGFSIYSLIFNLDFSSLYSKTRNHSILSTNLSSFIFTHILPKKYPYVSTAGMGACACLWYENLASLGIEKYIEKALRADAKTVIEMLIYKVILYDDRIEIHYKYTDKNPDKTLAEVHRDFLLCDIEIKITQRDFSAKLSLRDS